MAKRGLIIAGLASMGGKTLISLGLMRALKDSAIAIAAAKAGPDYIDPGFHHAALGRASINLDGFAMGDGLLRNLARDTAGEVLIIEGVMGVHDGGAASSAHLARRLGIPVVLVMDIRGQAETAGAVAAGIAKSLADMGAGFAGVILNRARSPRHAALAESALRGAGIAVFGAVDEDAALAIPSRHLGLVQAGEMNNAEAMISNAARLCREGIDTKSLLAAAGKIATPDAGSDISAAIIPPPGERVALAEDAAFGFFYPHLRHWWEKAGAKIIPFSPLADEAPDDKADFVFLPGGYPELHLDTLARARHFHESLRQLAQKGVAVYGECGGYMVLGEGITGKDGTRHAMTGLLGLETDFSSAARHRHLGYRRMTRLADAPLPVNLRGHEFHYTSAIREEGAPLFDVADKDGNNLGAMGLVCGNVAGSYLHMIAGC